MESEGAEMPLTIFFVKSTYMIEGNTSEHLARIREARFRWHSPPKCTDCGACNAGMPKFRWWTDDEAKVIALAVAISKVPRAEALVFRDDALEAKAAAAIEEAAGRGAQRDWLSTTERD